MHVVIDHKGSRTRFSSLLAVAVVAVGLGAMVLRGLRAHAQAIGDMPTATTWTQGNMNLVSPWGPSEQTQPDGRLGQNGQLGQDAAFLPPTLPGTFPQDESIPAQGPELAGFGSAQSILAVEAQIAVAAADQRPYLFITARIRPGWHIYSITQPPGGPLATRLQLSDSPMFRLAGPFRSSPAPSRKKDPLFNNLEVESHHEQVVWFAPLELAPGVDPTTVQVAGAVRYQACDARSCRPPQQVEFAAVFRPGPPPIDVTAETPTGQASGKPAADFGLLLAVGLSAFLGGLILNLMPCVLPVISLKLLAFIEQGGQSRGRIFLLNLWYTAGLMSVFLLLGTLSASFNLAWGEQFTLTWFKVTMTALVFVMALSFLGVWEIPIPGFVGGGSAGKLQAKEGALGAFAKGVLTTILATPCTGPFLGPVFGFTLEQPPYMSYLIFGTVGLGMASPYLLIGAVPELIRFLPRPGAWMETLKQVMAFLLLGTVVYLFSTMNERYFIPTLTLLVGLWFACWLVGRTSLTASPAKRRAAWMGGLAAAAATGLLGFVVLLESPRLPWQPFSPEALAAARAEGKTVMVDFTADWCPNCKWNLVWAIDTKRVHKLVEEYGVVPMIADWTDHSPMIKDFLATVLKRQSIPVLAIWPAGGGEVIVLDGTLLESQVLEALRRAGPSNSAAVTGPNSLTSSAAGGSAASLFWGPSVAEAESASSIR